MLDVAESAATAGNLASADELLRKAARIQEAELGPVHPELANTLNNLAIVAEKAGRPDEAETFYRRAASIAAAALPADHPMVVASRQNLEDFVHARAMWSDAANMKPSAQDAELGLGVFAPDNAAGAGKAPSGEPAADADLTASAAPRASGTRSSAPGSPSARVSQPPARSRGSLAWVSIAVLIVVAGAFLVSQPWSSRDTETSTTAPAAEPTVPQAAEPAPPPPAEPPAASAPAEPAQPPAAVPPADEGSVASSGITLAAVDVCRSFSSGTWRCDPAGESVAPGPVVFYTRVRSPSDTAVVHNWYRGDTLRRTVKLTIRANPTDGYRTYSRQTVDAAEDWRVEVRTADGDLLHEQRFAVR